MITYRAHACVCEGGGQLRGMSASKDTCICCTSLYTWWMWGWTGTYSSWKGGEYRRQNIWIENGTDDIKMAKGNMMKMKTPRQFVFMMFKQQRRDEEHEKPCHFRLKCFTVENVILLSSGSWHCVVLYDGSLSRKQQRFPPNYMLLSTTRPQCEPANLIHDNPDISNGTWHSR